MWIEALWTEIGAKTVYKVMTVYIVLTTLHDSHICTVTSRLPSARLRLSSEVQISTPRQLESSQELALTLGTVSHRVSWRQSTVLGRDRRGRSDEAV